MKNAVLVVLLVVCYLIWASNLAYAQTQEKELAPNFFGPVVTKTTQQLAKMLQSKDVKVRREAAQSLYHIKWHAAPVIAALMKALKDPDDDVRGFAAGCFHYFGGPQGKPAPAVPILAEMLSKDPSPTVRAICAASLCHLMPLEKKNIDSEALVPIFMAASREKDKWIRLRAARGLIILGNGGQKPFRILAELLGEKDDTLHREAIGELSEAGLRAVPVLKECLQHKSVRIRIGAMSAINVMASARSKGFPAQQIVPILAKMLQETDTDQVTWSICALAAIGPRANETVPVIIRLLEHHDPWVRQIAAAHLGKFGPASKKAIPALGKATADPNRNVRGAAVETLGKFDKDAMTVVPILIRALKDEDSCHTAAEALARFGASAKSAIPHLIALLKSDDHHIRWYAAQALGKFGSVAREAIPMLKKTALTDRHYSVRMTAVISLSKFREDGPIVIPILIKTLADQQSGVRMWSAVALGQFGPAAKRAVPRLTERLKDDVQYVRTEAEVALKKIGERSK